MIETAEPTDGRTMRERMLAGELYIADDPAIIRDSNRAHRLTHLINTLDPTDFAGRRRLMEELFGAFGEGSLFRPPLHVDYGYQVTVGSGCFANWGLMIADVQPVVIGDDVQIGPDVKLMTATHPLEAGPRRDKWESAAPITIGNNVWLGAGVVVCPGVTIGADTVVGAGAVVVSDLPAGVLAVGVPARVIREL